MGDKSGAGQERKPLAREIAEKCVRAEDKFGMRVIKYSEPRNMVAQFERIISASLAPQQEAVGALVEAVESLIEFEERSATQLESMGVETPELPWMKALRVAAAKVREGLKSTQAGMSSLLRRRRV